LNYRSGRQRFWKTAFLFWAGNFAVSVAYRRMNAYFYTAAFLNGISRESGEDDYGGWLGRSADKAARQHVLGVGPQPQIVGDDLNDIADQLSPGTRDGVRGRP
jgi:hypothetical protein